MKDVHKLIETVVTTKALAAYLTAESDERFGIYADCTFAVGKDIGKEIEPNERPIACIKCPGINNIDTTYFTDDFVTYNHVTGMYDSIEQDQTGEIDEYTLAGVIRECCENGEVDTELEELKNALGEMWCADLTTAQECMSGKSGTSIDLHTEIESIAHPEWGIWRVTKTPSENEDWYHIKGESGENVLFARELPFWRII